MGDARSAMHSMLSIVFWKQLTIIIGDFISHNSILPRRWIGPPGGAGIRFRAYISNHKNQKAKTPYISN